jgi:uncharacterized Tic20 family protein
MGKERAVNETSAAIPQSARKWAMACHLVALVGLIGNGIGFLLAPLIVWLVKKDEHPFIDEQGKEAVNFQLTMLAAAIVSGLLVLVLIGIVLLGLVILAMVVFPIIGAIKANDGEHYRYPFSFRLIK